MITITGIFNSAVCFCDELDEASAAQIQSVCDRPEFAGSDIRIMPDVHAGMGCTIGTTMTVKDKVVPGMVGVDIGCGMETAEIDESEIDFVKLDRLIRHDIPSGRDVRKNYHALNDEIDLNDLRCAARMKLDRARHSIGSLGGGNHFIEVGRAEGGGLFVVIHSGSRHIGTEVAGYYQNEAWMALNGKSKAQTDKLIAQLKAEGREKEIQSAVGKLKASEASKTDVPKDLAYAEGSLFDDYIHDMRIIQRFAALNRQAMMDIILRGMGFGRADEGFTTVHNYIDTDSMILRKGAVSAKAGEKLLVPINMRDGSLICVGRGNAEWNYSAPHGAGRVMSRTDAFKSLSMEEYSSEMLGIFSTCVCRDTLDESPMAYKSMDAIVTQIAPSADIIAHIKPVYNFKAGE